MCDLIIDRSQPVSRFDIVIVGMQQSIAVHRRLTPTVTLLSTLDDDSVQDYAQLLSTAIVVKLVSIDSNWSSNNIDSIKSWIDEQKVSIKCNSMGLKFRNISDHVSSGRIGRC